MQISKIAAHVRFSKDIGGSWKSLELAAEADVTIMDDWTVCQAELYSQLSQQLRQLWNNGNGTALNSQNGGESHVEPPAEPAPVSGSETRLEHWCDEHQAEFKRRQKAGVIWYSNKGPDGSWCNEPELAERR